MKKNTRLFLLPILIALLSAFFFGISTPISKILLRELNPFTLAGLLYLGASVGLLPIILIRNEIPQARKLLSDKKNRVRLFGAILLGGIIGPVFLLKSLQLSTASSISLWLNFEMVATVVLGFLFFRDYLGKKGMVGILFAMISGLLLTLNEAHYGFQAATFAVLACLCWGFDNHFTALIDGISAVQSTFFKGIVASSVNLSIGLFIYEQNISFITIIYSLILGFISYGVSIVLYIISAQKMGATRSQIIFSSAPFFGLLFSLILLPEVLSLFQMLASILIIISIIIISLDKHYHHHEHHSIEHTHIHSHDDLHHEHEHKTTESGGKLIHEHSHFHEYLAHSHPHWPDLHHRHKHDAY